MTNTPDSQNQRQQSVPPQGSPGQQAGHPYGQPPGPYPPDPGSHPGQQQYSQWYNPNAGPQPARRINKADLVRKPVYLLLLISAALYVLLRMMDVARMVVPRLGSPVEGFDGEAFNAFAAGQILSTLLFTGLFLGLYLLVLIPIAKGLNWGRVVGFVFAALGSMGSLFGLLGIMLYRDVLWIPTILVSIAFLGVNIAWIVVAAKTWEKPAATPYPYPPFH